MGAKRCLLTHFSQRYPKLPHLSEALLPSKAAAADEATPCDVVLAFDYMRLRIGDAWKGRYYLPPLQALLRELDPKVKASPMQTD
jgi:ribonuclease Z